MARKRLKVHAEHVLADDLAKDRGAVVRGQCVGGETDHARRVRWRRAVGVFLIRFRRHFSIHQAARA